jgi:WD40 repeat protein
MGFAPLTNARRKLVFKSFAKIVILITLIALTSACGSASTTVPPTAITSSPSPTTVPPTIIPTPAADDHLSEGGQAAISVDTADQVERLRTLSGHSDRVMTLVFSGDGVYVASSSMDGTIKLWDVQSGQVVHNFQKSVNEAIVNDIVFSPDGRLLASANTIWDVESRQVIHTLERRGLASVAFSPDGSALAVALVTQPIKLWDVVSGEVLREFEEGTDKFNIVFSPDGDLLAAGGLGGKVRLWDVVSGQIAGTFEYGDETGVHDVAFSPDGSLLASGGTDCALRFWDVASGETIRRLSLRDGLFGLAFSPDGTILASAGGVGGVSLWDVESGRRLRTLPHEEELMTVAFSPDGTLLASGGYDNKIHLWGIPR